MADAAPEVVERSDKNRLAAAVASIAVYVDFDSGSDGCSDRRRLGGQLRRSADRVAGWLPGREAGGWFEYELERPISDRSHNGRAGEIS